MRKNEYLFLAIFFGLASAVIFSFESPDSYIYSVVYDDSYASLPPLPPEPWIVGPPLPSAPSLPESPNLKEKDPVPFGPPLYGEPSKEELDKLNSEIDRLLEQIDKDLKPKDPCLKVPDNAHPSLKADLSFRCV